MTTDPDNTDVLFKHLTNEERISIRIQLTKQKHDLLSKAKKIVSQIEDIGFVLKRI